MKSSIRIFHTGDFHLDSPFSCLDVKTSDTRRSEHRKIFCESLSRAVDDGCDLILISGDLFDCGYVSVETVNTVFSALEACKLPVFISPGNHDPYTPNGIYAKRALPKNVHVFSSEALSRVDLDALGVSVHGYAFTSNRYFSNPLSAGYTLKEGYINLLCAHTELDEAIPKFAPINRSQLKDSGFEYAALGHDHIHREPCVAGSTTYSYSGFAVGRSLDELGFGRALEITVDRETGCTEVLPVTLSEKRYMIERVDVSGADSTGAILEKIGDMIKEKQYGRETSLRVIVSGTISPDAALPSVDAERFSLALLQIEDDTIPLLDSSYLENDITLKGALYRGLLEKLRSEDEYERRVASEALRIGLCALEGKSFL